jgi:hypothetical protein
MAQLSGVTATIKYQECVLIYGQFSLEPVKVGIGNTDGARDMALIKLGFFGPGVNQ